MSTRYELSKKTTVKETQGGFVLYTDQRTFIFNGTGAAILKGVINGNGKEQIVEDILQKYETSKKEASVDFDDFVRKLENSGLIAEVNTS